MSDPTEELTPPDSLPDTLVEEIDSLDLPELKSARSYIERRIDALHTPLEAEIEATATGEVLESVDPGAYALVRKHPPDPDGSGVNTAVVSLYQVRRESTPDETESLRWTYLGDVRDSQQVRCTTCGATLDTGAPVCPHCGSEHIDTTEE